MPTKTYAYIDGFNLYHSLDELNQPYLKWLNLWELCQKLLREDDTLVSVKYFSAYATWRTDSYRRHQRYVSALEHFGVEPILGRFKAKTVTCRAGCGQSFRTHEEKETDVNIGAHLMADALRNRFDRALVITADTDINAAVMLARHETDGKNIDLVAPPGRKNRNSRALFEISRGKLRNSLLPERLTIASGRTIVRPPQYAPPTN